MRNNVKTFVSPVIRMYWADNFKRTDVKSEENTTILIGQFVIRNFREKRFEIGPTTLEFSINRQYS